MSGLGGDPAHAMQNGGGNGAHERSAAPHVAVAPIVPAKRALEDSGMGAEPERDTAHLDALPELDVPAGLAVEFRELVDKTLRQEYARLHKLTHEDLPEASLSQKPHRIVNFARIARANVLRLLALYRWKVECDLAVEPGSLAGGLGYGADRADGLGIPPYGSAGPGRGSGPGGDAKEELGESGGSRRRLGAVSTTWGIKSLLAAHDAQLARAHTDLAAASAHVFKRRRPNPDLGTAVDVLTTGAARRWPAYLRDTYEGAGAEPRTRPEVARALATLDRALAYRLAVREDVPPGLRVERICDGRVHLSAQGLFECSLTALGDVPADLLLLDLKLLLRVKEGTTGAESFPADLSPEALDHAINLVVNPVLRTDPACRTGEASVKNTALRRLYAVLRNMALSYQLQVLWSQARRLERFEWKDKMRCELAQEGAVLSVMYWLPRKHQIQAPGAPIPVVGGKIAIASESVPGEAEAAAASLRVTWEPSPAFMGLPADPTEQASRTFTIDDMQLDLAGLLAEVTRHHANVLIRRQHKGLMRLLAGKPELRMIFATLDDFQLTETNGTTSMDVRVYHTHWLRFQINYTTGILDVREARTAGMAALEKRIALVKNTLDDAPQRLLEQVYSLKKQYVLDALETKLEYLGLQASHAMKGVPVDELERYGLASTIAGKIRSKPFFVIPTLASPLYMLVIMLQEPGFAYAFVGVRPGANGQMEIGHFSWLDVGRILPHRPGGDTAMDGKSSSFEIPPSSINRIYAYANAKVMTLQLELQLIGRSIPYLLVQPSAVDPMPAIQVKAVDLLADDAASETSMRNVLFSIVGWEDARSSHAQTSIRLRRAGGSLKGISEAVKGKRRHVRFNETTSTLIMTPPNIAGHIAWVEAEWANVSRLLSVAGQVVKLARRKDLSSVSVVDFDLERLCCAYGHDQRVVLQFDNTSSRYSIRFPVGSDQRQPLHRNVESELEADFNRELALSSMSRACDRFMKYLTASTPCLQALFDIAAKATAQVVWRTPTSWIILWTATATRTGFEVTLLVEGGQVKIQDVASTTFSLNPHQLGNITALEKFRAYLDRASALHPPSGLEMRCQLDDGAVLLCSIASAVHIIDSLAESINANAQD